jgi:aldehyde dehydrogenase (NAD+)/aldehyde dehydrogenase
MLTELFQVPRAIEAGEIWVKTNTILILLTLLLVVLKNLFGRENHKMALDHCVVKKHVNLLRQRTVGSFN